MTTLRADMLGLQWLSTDPTELRVVRKFGLTFRALHRHCSPLDYSLWPAGRYVKHLVCESFLDGLLVKERIKWSAWERHCVSSWMAHRGQNGNSHEFGASEIQAGEDMAGALALASLSF